MNVVEAYIKYKGQLLIMISGLTGCGKTQLASSIHRDFKIHWINQFDYYKKDYHNIVTLPSGQEINNLDSDDAIDWVQLNSDIDKHKNTGLVVTGFSLQTAKITAVPDYSFNLKLDKHIHLERMELFTESHNSKSDNKIDFQVEKTKFNKFTYQYYLDSIAKSSINKFINVTDMSEDAIYDTVFDIIIDVIKRFLHQDQYNANANANASSTQQEDQYNQVSMDRAKTKAKPKPKFDTKKKPVSNSIELELVTRNEPIYVFDKEMDEQYK